MSETIRTYTTEFKQDAIEYAETHPELSVKDAAEHLGIPKAEVMDAIKDIYDESKRIYGVPKIID